MNYKYCVLVLLITVFLSGITFKTNSKAQMNDYSIQGNSLNMPKKNGPFKNRFTILANGIIQDGKTGLMWAAADNGEDITWEDALKYCQSFKGGNFNDWRMPTIDELVTLSADQFGTRDTFFTNPSDEKRSKYERKAVDPYG